MMLSEIFQYVILLATPKVRDICRNQHKVIREDAGSPNNPLRRNSQFLVDLIQLLVCQCLHQQWLDRGEFEGKERSHRPLRIDKTTQRRGLYEKLIEALHRLAQPIILIGEFEPILFSRVDS